MALALCITMCITNFINAMVSPKPRFDEHHATRFQIWFVGALILGSLP